MKTTLEVQPEQDSIVNPPAKDSLRYRGGVVRNQAPQDTNEQASSTLVATVESVREDWLEAL